LNKEQVMKTTTKSANVNSKPVSPAPAVNEIPAPATTPEIIPPPQKLSISKETFRKLSTLAQLLVAKQKVLFVGPPGIGKTGRVHDVVEELTRATGVTWKLMTWRLIQKDRLDTAGAIFPDKENGVAYCLPLEDLKYLRETNDYVIFFMDDLGQAYEDVSSAVMAFFDKGAFGANVRIMGATNTAKHGAGVRPAHEALRTRFNQSFEIATPDNPVQKTDATGTLYQPWLSFDAAGGVSDHCEYGGWLRWAVKTDAPAIFLAFHRAHAGKQQLLYNWQPARGDFAARFADFRTWEAMIDLWKVGIQNFHVWSATIGRPVAAEFDAFVKLVEKVPSLEQIRRDPEGALVPDESSASYFVCTMLANSVGAFEAERIMKYTKRMSPIYMALFARDVWMRHKDDQTWRVWFSSPAWVDWLKDNQDLLWQ
jgi:hypothetical protein